MIIGIGIDFIEIKRLDIAIKQHGKRIKYKLFTSEEIAYCDSKPHPIQHYAGRFAAKEATFKALGSGWPKGLAWIDIEVISNNHGKPILHLHKKALERFILIGGLNIHISISHTQLHAIAQVIFEN